MTRRVPLSSPTGPQPPGPELGFRLASRGSNRRRWWVNAFLPGLQPQAENPE